MKTTTARQQAALDTILANITSGGTPGSLRIYSGTAPDRLSESPSGTLLASCTMAGGGSFAGFGSAYTSGLTAAASGYVASGKFGEDTIADASGTAGYWRIYDGAGAAALQGSVGTSGAELNLTTLSVAGGYPVVITSMNATLSGLV